MPQNPLAFIAKNKSNAVVPGFLDAQSALFGAQRHGKYYEASYGATLFGGANASGATLSAALATTYVGLCLSNPAANTNNLIVQRVTGQIIVAPAAVLALGLIVGYSAAGVVTHTTPVTPITKKPGSGATATGKLDAACTIVGTPAWCDWLTTTPLAADLPGFVYDVDGAIVIMPGGYCAIGANVAGPSAGFVGSFEWEEAPL